MPKKRKGANLSRNTSRSRSMRNKRAQRTEEQIQQQNTDARVSMALLRQKQSEDTRAERNEVIRLEQRQSRPFTVNRRRTNDQRQQIPKSVKIGREDDSSDGPLAKKHAGSKSIDKKKISKDKKKTLKRL